MSRRKKIERQWPTALFLLAGALRSGLNLQQALVIVVYESPEPLRGYLIKRWEPHHNWMPRLRLIEHMFSGGNLDLVRAALCLSSEAGAELSVLLEKCARLLQEKIEFQEKVEILSAQGRFTAWVVGLSPIFLVASFLIFAPDLFYPLVTTSLGWGLLSLAGVMVTVGLWVVHRMARIEV